MHEDTYVRTDERERFYTKLIVRPWICGQMCLRAVLGRSKHTRVHTTRVYLWQSRFVPKTCCTGARKISIDLGRDFCRDARTSRGCLEKKNILLKIRFRSISTPPFFFAKPRSVYASPKCQVFFRAPLRSRDKPWGWNIAGVVATGGESPHESSKSIPKAPTDPSFLLSLLRPQMLVIRLESILYRGKK